MRRFVSGGQGAQSQPNRPYLSLMRAEQHTAFSSDEVAIAPVAGTLLLWPSQLLHGHSGNALDGRLSLSFNLLPTRLSGSSYGLVLGPLSNDVSRWCSPETVDSDQRPVIWSLWATVNCCS